METFKEFLGKEREFRLAIAYDRIDDSKNTLQEIVSILVNAEAKVMKPVLNTTIEFSIEVTNGLRELDWVMNQIAARATYSAYVKIYLLCFDSIGTGKIYNPEIDSEKDNRYIGKSFQTAKLHAEAAVKSFRGEFI